MFGSRTFRIPKNQGAFTLTELLVVIAIVVLMAALGVSAFKGGAASDGSRGASYAAATLFDAARSEAIMRRTPVRVIFDTVYNASYPENYLRRMTVAYSTNASAPYPDSSFVQSGSWVKLPGNAYFDISKYSRASGNTMQITAKSMGAAASGSSFWYYEYLPNGQINDSNPYPAGAPIKAVFSPGSVMGGVFKLRPDLKSLYGFVIGKLGHTQQFQDLLSLTQCP